jgi:2-keto-4-pentenoate hydratase/2-oxohepta-3-ene-1,7-dioic acid hydratase in catechol pathway
VVHSGQRRRQAGCQHQAAALPRVIAKLSAGLTLEPRDIIAAGTPPGVGVARKPPVFLKPGDVMETEIVEIGVIRNPIQEVQA